MGSAPTTSDAQAILRRAEAELRRLMAEAAEEGAYDVLRHLTSLAQTLSDLAGSAATARAGTTPRTDLLPSEAARSHKGAARPRKDVSLKGKRRRATARSGYPKFKRLGDDLVKIGSSRRDKKEYHHRAPKRVLLLLVDALLGAGGKGQLITSDDFLPVRDPEDNSDVPSYQSYLALGWLVQVDLAQRHGRQGYTLDAPESLRERVEELWRQLPTR